jgi:SHS2 domain-containing protein
MENHGTERPKWRLIEHTADIRLQVFGLDLKDLLINGAMGLTSLLGGGGQEQTDEVKTIKETLEMESNDREELLVDWLRELLFLNEVRGFCFREARFEYVSDTGLKAGLLGVEKTENMIPEAHIKAVTYHGLEINGHGSGLEAKVVLDI